MHRWGTTVRRPTSGVANILATLFLVSLTIIAGVVLWSFKVSPPAVAPAVNFSIRAGTSNPVWGDPTDCLPWFPAWLNYNKLVSSSNQNTTADYYLNGGAYALNALTSSSPGTYTKILAQNGKYYTNNFTAWWWGGFANVTGGIRGGAEYNNECSPPNASGDFSVMNSTQFIVASHSPDTLFLNQIEMIFICNSTVFVNGTLSSMTWFPGSTTQPAPDAPHLNKCGDFIPSGSYSTLYNRFAIFVPVSANQTTILANGDTFVMYVHTSSPYDPDVTGGNNHRNATGVNVECGPAPDCDDFHGAPEWCFTVPTACTIIFQYLGQPQTTLATLSLYNLIRG